MRILAQFQGSEMSPGLFQEFMVFVPGVTQGNEDAGSAQDFILLFRCKSGELGTGKSEISLYNVSGRKFLLRFSSCCNKLLGRAALRVLSNIHGGALP